MYEATTQYSSHFSPDQKLQSIDPLDLASRSAVPNNTSQELHPPSFLKPSSIFNNSTSYLGSDMQRITSMPSFKSASYSNNNNNNNNDSSSAFPFSSATSREIPTTTLFSMDNNNTSTASSMKLPSFNSTSSFQPNSSQGPQVNTSLSHSFPHLAADMTRSLSAPNGDAQYSNPYGNYGNDFITGVTNDNNFLGNNLYSNSNDMGWDVNYNNQGSHYSNQKSQFGLPVMSNSNVYPNGMVDDHMDIGSNFDIGNDLQFGSGGAANRRKNFGKVKMELGNGMDSIFPTSDAFVASEAVHGLNEPSSLLVNNVAANLPGSGGDMMEPPMSNAPPPSNPNDPEAIPKRQNVRYNGDMYTPQWVRYSGHLKEGYCDLCEPGKWLQLKNSAFWYHKQFYHGISSTSGKFFCAPVRTRTRDNETVEGLCHQCHNWIQVSSTKRRNSVLWFRHAHKCHVYHKPKNTFPRRR